MEVRSLGYGTVQQSAACTATMTAVADCCGCGSAIARLDSAAACIGSAVVSSATLFFVFNLKVRELSQPVQYKRDSTLRRPRRAIKHKSVIMAVNGS